MGTGLFRVIMVLLWALGGMVVALGLFNGDYALTMVGAVCFVIPLILPLVVIALDRLPKGKPQESRPVATSRAAAARMRAEGQWATQDALNGRKMLERNPDILLGRWGTERMLLGASATRRILTFATTSEEYHRACAEPNALLHTGSLFVYEPFGKMYRAVFDRRKKMGQRLIVLDPHGQAGVGTDYFNPLDFMRQQGEGMITDAGMIADMLLAPAFLSGLTDQETRAARTLLQGFIVYTLQRAGRDDRSLAEVRRNLIVPSHRFYKILEEMMGIESADGRISDLALTILDMTEDQRMAIIEACREATADFDNPAIARMVGKSSFGIDDLNGTPVSVFVVGQLGGESPQMQTGFGRVMLGTLMQLLARRDWRSGDPEYLVLFDGIEALGRMPLFERLLGGGLGDGMVVWPRFTGVSSLMDICLNWENVVGRADAITVLGQDGAFNLDWVSGLTAMSKFDDTGGGNAGDRPVHLRPQDTMPILRSPEIARFPDDEQIVFRKGVAPIRAWRMDWYHDELFRGMATHAPTF